MARAAAAYKPARRAIPYSMTSRGWCFTWNNPEPEYHDGSIPPPPPALRYAVWQLERGASGTEHLQGYAEFSSPLRLAGVRKWLPQAHWEPRRGTREAAREYCRKADSRCAGPWEHGSFEQGGQGKRQDLDAAVSALRDGGIKRVAELHPTSYVKYHRGLRALAEELEPAPSDPSFQPRPWQARILSALQAPADDRTIIWVVDSVGGRGKSRLVRHLVMEHNAVTLEGRLADMCYTYNKEPIVCFDISRAAAEHSDHLYSMAEKLKNGIYLSTKYESRQKIFAPPHVLFFANQMPDESKWSRDRVKIVNLDNE